MNENIYNYIMMDSVSFERYKKNCERNREPCNYHQVNADTYGVMLKSKKNDMRKVNKIK